MAASAATATADVVPINGARRKRQRARTRLVERVQDILSEAQQEVAGRRWENAIPMMRHAVEQATIGTDPKLVTVAHRHPSPKDPSLSDSTIQALDILSVFDHHKRDRPLLGIAELADTLGMSRSTVHRYVTTLCYCGQLEQHPPSRKYRRPALHAIAGAGQQGEPAEVRELARAA